MATRQEAIPRQVQHYPGRSSTSRTLQHILSIGSNGSLLAVLALEFERAKWEKPYIVQRRKM